jgi:hypothetical protein
MLFRRTSGNAPQIPLTSSLPMMTTQKSSKKTERSAMPHLHEQLRTWEQTHGNRTDENEAAAFLSREATIRCADNIVKAFRVPESIDN